MSDFVTVAKVGDIPNGKGQAYVVNNRMVAVFHVDGTYYAMDDMCPHMGASLAPGAIYKGAVTCPWHAWQFCLKDGTWVNNPRLKIDSFEVRVEGEDIQVHVPPRAPQRFPGT